MVSLTRSRDLVSGSLTVLLAALERAQEAVAEAIVEAHQLRVCISALLVTWLRQLSLAVPVWRAPRGLPLVADIDAPDDVS